MRRTLTIGLSLTLGIALAIPAALAAKRPIATSPATETPPAEEKKEEKKEEAKPAVAPAKAAEAKPAEVKPAEPKALPTPFAEPAKTATATPPPAAPEAPKPPAPEPAERIIEKSEADFQYKLTIRPGNLKVDRVAEVRLQVWKKLDRPDPVTGDRAPLATAKPIASVKPPEATPEKGKKPAPVTVTRYSLWPLNNPGEFGFHFTPTADGIFEVSFKGEEQKNEDNDPAKFDVRFRLGVGTAAAETEQSPNAAAKKTARRPIGGETEQQTKLEKVMEEIGHRYLGLEAMLAKPPAKGPHAEAAAEARAIAALFSQVKGQMPSGGGNAAEFDKLALAMTEKLDAVAEAAENAKDRNAARAALSNVEIQGCNQCHGKYRYEVTDNLSEWPKFRQKLKK